MGVFIEKVREVDVVTHNRLVQMVTGKFLARNYISGQYVRTGTSKMQEGSLSFGVRQGGASTSPDGLRLSGDSLGMSLIFMAGWFPECLNSKSGCILDLYCSYFSLGLFVSLVMGSEKF